MEAALIRRIETAIRGTRIGEADFGRLAIRDPNLMRNLRAGRELRTKTRARIEAYLDTIEPKPAPPPGANGHRGDCDCEECWQTVHPALPPARREGARAC